MSFPRAGPRPSTRSRRYATSSYAAIRPRLGAGRLDSLALAYLYPNMAFMAMECFPMRLLLIGTVWAFFEITLATVAGAWLYKE